MSSASRSGLRLRLGGLVKNALVWVVTYKKRADHIHPVASARKPPFAADKLPYRLQSGFTYLQKYGQPAAPLISKRAEVSDYTPTRQLRSSKQILFRHSSDNRNRKTCVQAAPIAHVLLKHDSDLRRRNILTLWLLQTDHMSDCFRSHDSFLPRWIECRRGLAMRILSVRPSVRPCVRPSVTRVDCDKTVERSVQIYTPYEKSFS